MLGENQQSRGYWNLWEFPLRPGFFIASFYDFEGLELLLNVKKLLSFRNWGDLQCVLPWMSFQSPKHRPLRTRFSPEWKLYTCMRSKHNFVKLNHNKKVWNSKWRAHILNNRLLALNEKHFKQYLVSELQQT